MSKIQEVLNEKKDILQGFKLAVKTLDEELDNEHDFDEFMTLFEAREISDRAIPKLEDCIKNLESKM